MEYDSRVMYTTGQKSGVMTISKGKESDEISGNIELIDCSLKNDDSKIRILSKKAIVVMGVRKALTQFYHLDQVCSPD